MTALANAATSAPRDLVRGAVLSGKYTLLRPLGAGGMGEVWLACNEATGAEVALKVLLPYASSAHGSNAGELSARFRREAYTTARLCHRNIVRIYDLVESELANESSMVLVMEVLRGQTLAALLHGRTLGLEEALAVLLPVLSALSYAHDAGIVHRDLKPENIFLALDPDGVATPKLLDFGISKVLQLPEAPVLTRRGEILGTPSYMSPEQVRGMSSVGAQSDIFNVGILLYEMLTGKNPFAGGRCPMLVAILEERPAPIAGLDPKVWREVERALEKNASARHASVADLAHALRRAAGLPLTAFTGPASARDAALKTLPPAVLPPRSRARTRLLGIVALALAIGVTVSAGALGLSPTSSAAAASPTPRAAAVASLVASFRAEPAAIAVPLALSIPVAARAPAGAAPKISARPPADRQHGILREPGF